MAAASSVLLLIAVGVPTVLANLGLRHLWARVVAFVWVGALAGLTALFGATVIGLLTAASLVPGGARGTSTLQTQGPAAVFLLAAVLLILLLPALLLPLFSGSVRRRLARLLPLDADNPVHIVAMALFVVTLVLVLLEQVMLTAFPALARQVFASSSFTAADIVSSELPYAILGFLGVGVFLRRDLGQSLQRLGLVRPALWQVSLALALAGLLFLAGAGLERLGDWLTPDLSRQLAETNQGLFRQVSNPVSALIVGLAAGACEEILFRGALQPRLGIPATAVLFGVVHVNYGVSLSLVTVILIAVVLAVLRRYTNTTTTIVTHATFDAIALGISSWLVYPLTAGMAVVFGAAAAAVLFRARRLSQAPPITSSAPAQPHV